jgi:hypothetical protein
MKTVRTDTEVRVAGRDRAPARSYPVGRAEPAVRRARPEVEGT